MLSVSSYMGYTRSPQCACTDLLAATMCYASTNIGSNLAFIAVPRSRQKETVAVTDTVRGAPSHAAFSVIADR